MIIIKNVNENPRDPDVIFHNNLFYATYSYKRSIWIKFASKVEELIDAKGQIVFTFDPNTKYSKITHDVVLDLYEKQNYSMIEVKKHFEKFYNVDIPLYDLYEILKRIKRNE